MSEQGSLAENVEVFAKFGECFIAGLAPRFEGEITSPGPDVAAASVGSVVAEAGEGALLGRTLWGGEGEERTGCFLWIGDVAALLGDEAKPVTSLSDEEIATLDGSLRLSVEEGGGEDEKPPLDWSGLERVTAEELPGKLAEVGVAGEFERARLVITLAGRETTFLFLPTTETTEASPAEPLAEGQYQGTSHGVGEDAARTAATVVAAAGSGATTEPAEPAETFEPAEAAVSLRAAATAGAMFPGIPAEQLHNLEHLLDVRLPLTIRLGSTRMNLDDLLKLTPGAILELDRREDEPLEVIANGQVVARGEVVVVDERFGLRITDLGTPEEHSSTSR